MRRNSEPTHVFVELVAASYAVLVPAAIMAAIFLGVGLFSAWRIGGVVPWTAIAAGMTASASRVAVIIAYRRRRPQLVADRKTTAAWERRLGTTTIAFAASVALLGAYAFGSSHMLTQMLAIGQLFGFCAGVVARGYIRPRICAACVAVATLPVAVAAVLHGGPGYWMMAVMLVAFLAGSLETIRHSYNLVREQIDLRNEMTMVARHDPLTGLVNRFGLRGAFADLVEARGEQSMVAVHCIDVDRFKPVNDRFGHPAGDELLRQLAERIRATVRPGDIAARLGGDEFVVVQGGITHTEEAEMFARRLARAISASYTIAGHFVEIGVSLGYATSRSTTASLDTLLTSADATLYRVKNAGGGGVGSSPPRAARRP